MTGLTLLSNHCASCRPRLLLMLHLISFVTVILVMAVIILPFDNDRVKYHNLVKHYNYYNNASNTTKHLNLLITNATQHPNLLMTKTSLTQNTPRKRTKNPLLVRDRLSGITPTLSLNYSHMNYNLEKKKLFVLLWNPPFLNMYNSSEQPKVCEYTYDRDLVQQADFVFFTARSLGNLKKLPSRTPSQRWVIHTKESAQNGYLSNTFLTSVANIFNYSSHYSIKADIHYPYGWCEDSFDNDESRWPPLPNKTGLVFWISSNCHSKSKRERYVQSLKKHIEVHSYGRCGNYAMPRQKQTNRCGSLCQKYKFYLSFENSFCTEYVTEKLYKIISDDSLYVIPIVMGLDEYDMLPKDAIIDVRDFSSTKLLAEHLQYLNNNNTAFMKYFEWRNKRKCFLNESNQLGAVPLCDSLWKLYTTSNNTSVLQRDKLLKTFGIQNCVKADEFYKDFLLD